MAGPSGPSASDPKDLKIFLNSARRRALSALIGSIISHMHDKTEHSFHSSPTKEVAPLSVNHNNRRDQSSSESSPALSDPEEQARQRRLEARLEKSLSTPKLQELKKDTLRYFEHWASEVRAQFRKTCEGPEDPRAEQKRREWQASRGPSPPPYTPTSSADTKNPFFEAQAEAAELVETKSISLLQSLYTPIPTRLTTISREDKVCTVSCMVLLLLSLGHYSAHSRILLLHLTSSLSLPLSVLTNEETQISLTLLHASQTLNADPQLQARAAENASSRRWKVGLASLAGAAVIGITGGLAAPVVAGAIGGIMGGVGLGGIASFLGIFAMNGALVGSLFGAFGGKMTGEMVDAYAKEVQDFKFLPVREEWGEGFKRQEAELEARRLRVTIGINGWLNKKDDVIKPWRVLGKDSEVFALRYELDALLDLGASLENMVTSYAWSYVKIEILKRTVLTTLWAALWPLALLKMATSIDNPFAMARNRSEKAGEVLADALIHKVQGERPVTLIGYSLGSRVIYSCLKSLAERRAFGLVESVVLIGSPIPSDANNWRVMQSVVSGNIVNVYSQNDYILAFLYRATSIQFGVAGLQAIKGMEGVTNLDLSKEVSGHLRYPNLIGDILKKAGFEGVIVQDENIREEGEISLVDVEGGSGMGAEERKKVTKSGSEDLIEFLDDEPIEHNSARALGKPQGDSAVDDLTIQISGLGMDVSTSATKPQSQIQEPQVDKSVDDLITGIAGIDIHPPSKTLTSQTPSTTRAPDQPSHIDNYSDSDEGGIQMVDNDFDSGSELNEVDCAPIHEDDARDMPKTAVFEEQKSLGSFPKDRGVVSGSGARTGNES